MGCVRVGPSRPSGRWGGTVASSGTFFHLAEGGAWRSAASAKPWKWRHHRSIRTLALPSPCQVARTCRRLFNPPRLQLEDVVSNSDCKFFPPKLDFFFQLVFSLDSKLRNVTCVERLFLSSYCRSSSSLPSHCKCIPRLSSPLPKIKAAVINTPQFSDSHYFMLTLRYNYSFTLRPDAEFLPSKRSFGGFASAAVRAAATVSLIPGTSANKVTHSGMGGIPKRRRWRSGETRRTCEPGARCDRDVP